jgi:hypothetical protein
MTSSPASAAFTSFERFVFAACIFIVVIKSLPVVAPSPFFDHLIAKMKSGQVDQVCRLIARNA